MARPKATQPAAPAPSLTLDDVKKLIAEAVASAVKPGKTKAPKAAPSRMAVVRNTRPAQRVIVTKPPRGRRAEIPQEEKPPLPPLDPMRAMLDETLAAKEGNQKLASALEIMREGLEAVATAEVDYSFKPPRMLTEQDRKAIALEALNAYSRLVGQDWRRHKIVKSRAGGTGNKPVWPESMSAKQLEA